MYLDKGFDRAKLSLVQSVILRQFDSWLKPEFGLTLRRLDMYMHTRLFAREEVEAKTALAEYRRTHWS